MNEIVAASGLSKGAFYHYFTSKEELFKQVITHYYVELSGVGFSAMPLTSLKDFIEFYSAAVKAASETYGMGGSGKANGLSYFLHLFDAYRMLPEFKQQMMASRQTQIDGWLKIIKIARKSGEIKTPLKDLQIAKLFIYSGDGAGLGLILANIQDNVGDEMSGAWKSIYAAIKAR